MKNAEYCEQQIQNYIKKLLPNGIPFIMPSSTADAGMMKPREMDVSVLFADIRGATAISDRVEPDVLFVLLDVWCIVMGSIIARHNGTIIDYVGDQVIATFGNPGDEASGIAQRDSVKCAIEMQKELQSLNVLYDDIDFPHTEMGIGIHYGKVYAGNVGASSRLKYDIIGREVNLASRIQSKSKGGQILVSDTVKSALGEEIQLNSLKEICAKGIAEPVKIYEVLW